MTFFHLDTPAYSFTNMEGTEKRKLVLKFKVNWEKVQIIVSYMHYFSIVLKYIFTKWRTFADIIKVFAICARNLQSYKKNVILYALQVNKYLKPILAL